jgi:putative membrane protein
MTMKCTRQTSFLLALAIAALGGGVAMAQEGGGLLHRGTFPENEILGVIRAINQAEVDHATAVQARLTDPQVRGFAQSMIEDHTRAVTNVDELARTIAIQPAESDTSRKLVKDTRDKIEDLSKEESKDLDSKFLDDQENMHEDALKLIDDRLLKDTKRPDVSRLLGELRASVAAHLEQVRNLKKDLKDRKD